MSVDAMLAAHKLAVRMSHACYRVLMCLAEHADRSGGNSWPSVNTIAAEAQANERTVRLALAELEAAEIIAGSKKRGRGGVTIWQLTFPIAKLTAAATYKADMTPGITEQKAGATPGIEDGIPGVMPGIEDRKEGVTPAFRSGKPGVTPKKPGLTPYEPVLNLEEGGRASPSAPSRPEPRGCRLPMDWRPNDIERAFAAKYGLDPDRVAERFRNHWHGKAGAGARMVDWTATWRNWCLRDADDPRRPAPPTPRRPGRSYAGCL